MLVERGSRRREEGRKVAGFSHRDLARSDAMAAALGGAGAGAGAVYIYIKIPSCPPEAKRGKGEGRVFAADPQGNPEAPRRMRDAPERS